MNKHMYAAMVKRGLTYETLATQAGVAYKTVYNVLHEKGDPRISTVQLLAKALDVKIDVLYPVK